ncbi:response regulator transcription factor [Lacisediminimonas sp.]|uniref:response regulator transcription factor n=1 Tax=Lacisediminimonas sp. TaxID=3060582 RepID=UPI0027237146|nr:response regulator transcription factor [Lacisediminimonas sp.]MDO8299503.1 response regulator transcription factor [Lacisediminimonas sp.]
MAPTRSNPLSIIVADPDRTVLDRMVGALAHEGWLVEGVLDSHALYLALLQRPAQIVVLGAHLPPEGGVPVVRQLRSIRSTSSIGIIVLAQAGSPLRIQALQSGADASLAGPPSMEELKAYIKTLERRVCVGQAFEPAQIWHYHQSEWKLVSPSGADIDLSHLEAAFVYIIARQAGRPVRRRDIIAQAFGQDPLHYDNRRLEALVSRLRKKVHRCYPLSQPIKVVHSVGYVFTDAIRCIELPALDSKTGG